MAGPVERVGEDEANEYWSTRAPAVRLSAAASHQSRVVASRAVLEMQVQNSLRRHPGGADVPRPRRWGGFRVLPTRVEFWQESPDGLHDRIRYRREPAAGSSSGCRHNDPAAADPSRPRMAKNATMSRAMSCGSPAGEVAGPGRVRAGRGQT